MITIYTDGSARPNPGPGGWSLLAFDDNKLIECKSFQTAKETTNNKMEMSAILYAFHKYGIKNSSSEWAFIPIVYTDSNYAQQTFSNWMFSWANHNWIKADKHIPENLDIVLDYYDYYKKGYRIDLRWVKGHADNKYNEIADKLSTGKLSEMEVWHLWKNGKL